MQQQVVVTVPAGAAEGTLLQVMINGANSSVAVPAGVKPGEQFTVACPAIVQQAPVVVQQAPVVVQQIPGAPIQAAVVHAVEAGTAEQRFGDSSCGSLRCTVTTQLIMDSVDTVPNFILAWVWLVLSEQERNGWWTTVAGPFHLVCSIWAIIAGSCIVCCNCSTASGAVQHYRISLAFGTAMATLRVVAILKFCVDVSDDHFAQVALFWLFLWLAWGVNVLIHRVIGLVQSCRWQLPAGAGQRP